MMMSATHNAGISRPVAGGTGMLAGLMLWLASAALPVGAAHGESFNDLSFHVPAGRLVDIGTHTLHVSCLGQGQPAVIIDAGLGSSSLEWLGIQKALARNTRTCIYDRAGYGLSEPGPLPRTSSRIADELFLLLRAAAIPGPYVLVGHSFGGYDMQIFASRYRQYTAGLVLVESSHPEQVERFLQPPLHLRTAPSEPVTGAGYRRMLVFSVPRLPANLPLYLRHTVFTQLLRLKTKAAIGNEYLHFRASAAQVEALPAYTDLPLLVLSRGRKLWKRNHRGRLLARLWRKLQTELASRSPYSAQIIANRSGHNIHLDQPQLVIDSIALMTDISRQSYPSLLPVGMQLPPQSWYAFRDATWVSDHLHTRSRLGPLQRGRTGQNGRQFTGRVACPLDIAFARQEKSLILSSAR